MEYEALQQAYMHVMQRWRKAGPPVDFEDITMREFFVLEMLVAHKAEHPGTKGMYVSTLASFLHTSGPAVSRMLRSLDEKGYIERIVDTADRRNTYICMTPQGESAWERSQADLQQFMCGLFDEVGYDNMIMLISLWNRLIDVIIEKKQNEGMADDVAGFAPCGVSDDPMNKKES